ncbi:adenylate/guanylate cyclase domain-containing protein [Bradyrhizobium sp. 190]|uniref:adenylate/guanylate cyclase domain-containing protein n=1 Tax=Bradyrhizobium sp. 190 TaxID=2782658 RepID=UPI001FF9DD6F|nr:adenylate/guanylate cyclase domain-containing protein [Bradyrhizobium sp. 190]
MDLGGWLRRLGLEQYEAAFRENAISEKVLPNLTAEDLKDLGVGMVGHRRMLLDAIAALRAETSAPTPLCDAPLAIDKAAKDTAERRQITVMFSDLVGSTALSARLDPEDLREVISAYQRCVAETVRRCGGFVAKYMGDGVLIYFGYPAAHEDDAERAVRSGLALIDAVATLPAPEPLQVRIGVATGLVVVGDLVGSGEAQERGIVGETPNLAARLQGIAEPNTVVIAEATRRLLGNLFELQDLGPKELKGITGPVTAFAALRASSVESRFEAMHPGGLTALVGREEELELLLRRWARAKTGEGQVVLLSGEAGIGKSRLSAALMEGLAAEPHTRLRCFCSPQHTDSAFYPLIGQFERAAGFAHGDTPQAKLDKLDALLAQTSTSRQDAALLTEMLSLPNDGRYPALEPVPEQRRQKMLAALGVQLEALARSSPVLMILEDAQWADPTSLEAFGRTVDRIASLCVLIIVTFRPEFEAPWVGQPHVTALAINRLGHRDVGTMIDRVVGNKALPANIRKDIVERTDGIPLFVEEMTKAVLEAGGELEAMQIAAAVPTPALAVPASLHASLMARLDRLGPAKEVAQIGAAIGREFSHALVAAVVCKPEPELGASLDRLIRAGLLFRKGMPPHAIYLFKHALVQDAAYGTLLRSGRQQLHARIAATLEDQFPEIVLTQPALLARHCAEAGLSEKSVAYWLKAGRRAMARSAMAEAVAQLRKGLDALTGLPDGPRRRQQELDLQLALRQALAFTKGLSSPDVGETIARARALAEQLDRPEYLVRLSFGQWAFHLGRSEHKLALSLAEQIEKIAEARNDARAQLRARRANGMTRLHIGEFVAARALLDQCHGLADAHRGIGAGLVEDPYATMLAYLAVTLAHLGYIDQSRLRLEEALTETRRLRHAQTLAVVLVFANWTGWITRSPETGRYTEELLAVSTEHRFPLHFGWATAFHGASLTALGQAHEGLTLLTQGLEALRATGTVLNTSIVLMWLAEAYAMIAQPSDGLNCLAEAARMIETTEERTSEAELHRLRGDLLNATGDPAATERNYHQALAVARSQSAKLFELRASTSLARLWRDQGKQDEARKLLAPVYGWFTEGFDTLDLKQAKALLDELA